MVLMNNAYKYSTCKSPLEISVEDAKFKQLINISI